MRNRKAWPTSVGAALVLALLAACGEASTSSSGGVGSQPGEARPLSELRIGYSMPGTSNAYLQAMIRGANDAARDLGVGQLEILEGANFDAQAQVNEIQAALQRKTYNGMIIAAANGDLLCNVTRNAAKQVPVVTVVTGLCQEPNGFLPGTVSYVGEQFPHNYETWWEYIFTHTTPGPIANFTGPPNDFVGNIEQDAMNKLMLRYPGFTLAADHETDFQAATGYQKAQATLQANPGVTAMVSNYTGITQGIVRAVAEAGLAGKVKVYDLNGDEAAVEAVQRGDIDMTYPGMPYTNAYESVRMLAEYWQGKETSEVVDTLQTLDFPGAPAVDRSNAETFRAEY